MMEVEEKREHSYNHVLKYTGIFGGVQGLNILIGLVRNKIIAKLLGPTGMGLASLFNTAVNFISQTTNLGISFSAIRHVSELFDEGDEARIAHFVKVVRGWCLLTALFGMLVCILLGPVLSDLTFSWGDHTLHFVLLSPAVAMMAITGGETAILKGARQLRSLAFIQLANVFLALLISVPLYYFFGFKGIVPVIILMAFANMMLTIWHSYRLYPLRLGGVQGILGEGMEMMRLGVAFVMAGVLGSGAEMFIRSYLNVQGDLGIVGLYNAGFMLTVTYAGMVFSAMETDYFPRLSAVMGDRGLMNETVNRQIEVSVLLVSPMLAMLIVGLPVIIPILFSDDFLPVVSMAQVAVFSMYLKAVSLPISYMTLARGDSKAYLIIETFYDLLLVALVIIGYRLLGLYGTGLALSLSYLAETLIVYLFCHIRYGFRLSAGVVQCLAMQLPLGLSVYMLVFVNNTVVYWFMGTLICFVSLAISLYVLHQKTSLWNALKRKFLGRHEQ